MHGDTSVLHSIFNLRFDYLLWILLFFKTLQTSAEPPHCHCFSCDSVLLLILFYFSLSDFSWCCLTKYIVYRILVMLVKIAPLVCGGK